MNKTNKVPVLFTEKKECCGCSACEAICPQGAIKMKPDNQGFKYPYITKEMCICCGRCVEVCAFK